MLPIPFLKVSFICPFIYLSSLPSMINWSYKWEEFKITYTFLYTNTFVIKFNRCQNISWHSLFILTLTHSLYSFRDRNMVKSSLLNFTSFKSLSMTHFYIWENYTCLSHRIHNEKDMTSVSQADSTQMYITDTKLFVLLFQIIWNY